MPTSATNLAPFCGILFMIGADIFYIHFSYISKDNLWGIIIVQILILFFVNKCIYQIYQINRANSIEPPLIIENPLLVIETIPLIYEPYSVHNSDTMEECAICLESSGDNYIQLICKHIYHKHCIDNWYKTNNNTCPVCRADMTINYL